ncbi:MAG: T9SS type A sorting domain-containing protein [Bacteroidetes bacterium]|nr:T9SS type A sorting domain-containing protein [Bacteroidota bacterium]
MKNQILFIVFAFSILTSSSQTWQTQVYDMSNTFMKSNDVRSIDYNDSLIYFHTIRYYATFSYHFEIYNNKNQAFDSITSFSSNPFRSFYLKFNKGNDTLFFVSWDEINYFDQNSWKIYKGWPASELISNYNSRFDNNFNFILCSIFPNHLSFINPMSQFGRIAIPSSLTQSTPTLIEAIEIDSSGNYWTANCLDSGVFRYDKSNNSWTKYNQGYKTTHITKDKRGNLWFNNTTNAGVLKYDGTFWTSFDTINSCLDKRFYQPHIETFDNNLWIVDNDTITGELIIAKIQPDNFCIVFDSLGIIAEPRQFVIDSTETLWIATDKGVITFRDTGIYVNSIQAHNPKINNIMVYPNPTSDFITIDFGEIQKSEFEIEIYNITGQRVKSIKFKGKSLAEVNVKDLSQGLYIGKIFNSNSFVQTFKFVVE